MEIHGGMYSGDAGQKHNAETLWNYAFMEMHVDEIGIIVGAVLFYAMNEHTWCLVFSFSVCFLLFSLLNILSRSLCFFHQNDPCPFLFLPLTNISLFLFHIILIDIIFFKMPVVQFRKVTTL